MTLEEIEANYASMAELARVHCIRVIFSSVLPVHNYTPHAADFFATRPMEKILELNRWLKNYCARSSGPCLYLDYFSAVVDDKGLLRRELAEDGLHPNDAGYKIMARLAASALDKALSNPKSRK
jgi:lysophospholipase L1-like esterase